MHAVLCDQINCAANATRWYSSCVLPQSRLPAYTLLVGQPHIPRPHEFRSLNPEIFRDIAPRGDGQE